MSSRKYGAAIALAVLGFVGVGAWQAKAWWSSELAPIATPHSTEKTVILQVPSGSSAAAIGDQLVQAGMIRSKQTWQLWSRLQSFQNRPGGFQAGSYEISSRESLSEIGDKIWTGKVVQTGFTIPEGWNIRQMSAYFEEKKFFTAQEFLNAVKTLPTQKYAWLPANLPLIEGFLFPDTYQLPAGKITPEEVLTVMLDRFEQVALPVYQAQQGTDPLKLNLLQWVTLASVVEKEAVVPTERTLIAGVFTNRLKQGMKLESDPTVEYAFGITQTPEKPLTYAQVGTPSPYNTYYTPGLPPTPIASPGLASLKATLSPDSTEYLFFVARYDGTHVFSRTLQEHESAQGKIRDRIDGVTPSPSSSPAASPKASPQASPSASPSPTS